jgi:hypothetical protein
MNSRSNTHQSSGKHRFYMIVPQVDLYRWVGGRTEADGAILSRVRHASVGATWRPVNVEWIPETSRRLTCDFPIFYAFIRCFSRRALDVLAPYVKEGLEVLALNGLDGAYVGIHCIRWVEGASNLEGVDQDRISIHSTLFVPRLRAKAIEGLDVFGVHEMPVKLFVSERFKTAVESNGLIGLDFHEVPLC